MLGSLARNKVSVFQSSQPTVCLSRNHTTAASASEIPLGQSHMADHPTDRAVLQRFPLAPHESTLICQSPHSTIWSSSYDLTPHLLVNGIIRRYQCPQGKDFVSLFFSSFITDDFFFLPASWWIAVNKQDADLMHHSGDITTIWTEHWCLPNVPT